MDSKRLSIALKVIFGVVFAAALFAASYNSFLSPETFRHAALGKEFLKDLGFPKADNFSYAGPASWDRSSWLFDFFIYSLCYLGGVDNLVYLKFFLFALFTGVLFLIIYKKQQGKYISITIPIGVLVLWMLDNYFKIIPPIFSYVFTMYFIFVLEQEPTKRNSMLYYTLPFIALFWANTSSTAPAAAALTLVYLLYYIADSYEMPERREKYNSPAILIAFAGVLGATFLSPDFTGAYINLYEGFKTGFGSWKEAIMNGGGAEWIQLLFFFLYMIGALVILFFNERGADVGRKSELIKDIAVVVLLLAASYSDRGYVPVFISATLPLLMYYAYLIFRWNIVWPLQWTEKNLLRVKNTTYLILIPLVIAFIVVRITGAVKQDYPQEAKNYLLANKIATNLFVEPEWTGFAEYYLYPAYQVMSDANKSRDGQLKREYDLVASTDMTITPILIKYGINSFLVKSGSRLAGKMASMGYKTAYFDGQNEVLVNPEQAKEYFKFINTNNGDDFYDKNNLGPSLKEMLAFAEKYPSVKAHLMAAKLYAAVNRKRAKAYLEETISNFESEYPLYNYLGKIYFDEGEYVSAMEVWEQSKEVDVKTAQLMKAAKKRLEREEE